MPVGVRPATGSNPTITSNRAGRATDRPMATTSFATDDPVRRWLKISRSSTSPMAGARTNTDRTRAGRIAQPHSSWAWKYIAADT